MYSAALNGEELCSEADHKNGGPNTPLYNYASAFRNIVYRCCAKRSEGCWVFAFFSYTVLSYAGDGSDWKGVCQNGTAQSPIDLPGKNGEQGGIEGCSASS